MSFAGLPSELVLLIAESLYGERDLNALSRCSHQLHTQLSDLLLLRNIKNHQSSALLFAAKQGSLALATRMIKLGARVDTAIENETATPLYYAAEKGHTAIFELLLASGANPNAAFQNNWVPLCAAAAAGQEQIVKILLARDDVDFYASRPTPFALSCHRGHEGVMRLFLDKPGLDVTASGSNAYPLLGAVLGEHEGAVRLLLDDGQFDPNFLDEDLDKSVLMYAAEMGRESIVQLLIDWGADPNLKNRSLGFTALYYAVKAGHDATVRLLLARDDVDPNMRCGDSGLSVLLWAASTGSSAAVLKTLLENPAVDVHSKDRRGRNALITAIDRSQEAAARVLLADGRISINEGDRDNRPPLAYAAFRDLPDIMELLLEAGADADHHDDYGRTALFRASEAATSLLLERGVEPDGRDKNSRSPLSWAASDGELEVSALLLAHGAEVDSRDNKGWTPLFYAIMGKHKILKLLLERGAVPNIRDHEGLTPLLTAAGGVCCKAGVVGSLLSKGADPNARDKNGRTALSLAAGFAFHGTMKLLLEHDGTDLDTVDDQGQTAAWWAQFVDLDDYGDKTEDEISKSIEILETWTR
ncbi:ankyrin repeat-containing domain protein [Aspergillus pseudoustus]|uniref:Ankyrin repeat-containing domain protein n=1 Tax=Aspergillus pseudoustus TaxID=1810923 RepID=A0ABR4J0Y6_9EURO